MPLAQDAAIPVHVVAGHGNDFRIDRNFGVWLDHHAVEAQLHPALAHKVAGVFVIFKPPDKVAVQWQHGAPVAFRVAQLAQNRIANGGCLR